MSGITTSTGIFSGINTGQLIDQLIQAESRPKILAQQRVNALQTQRAAFLDINSSLLALKTAAGSLRTNKVFQANRAASSDDTVLTATAANSATPGTYSLLVSRLVSTQQQISRGFADRTSTGVGATGLTLEVGGGRLDSDTALATLNGGSGVARGRVKITDGSGASAIVDLSNAVTVGDVLGAINSAAGVSVAASVEGDSFKVKDTSGGGGTLRIDNVTGSTTATSLGLAGVAPSGGAVTGTRVNTISAQTLLSRLNDGAGVSLRPDTAVGQPDVRITARDGTVINVELGKRTVTDPAVPPSTTPTIRVTQTAASTLQDVVTRINSATGNGGKVVASIDAATNRLVINDTTAGTGNLIVAEGASNDPTRTTAKDLGILTDAAGVAGPTVNGRRLIASLNSTLSANLNGGAGIGAGTIRVTQRNGSTRDIVFDGTEASITDVLSRINGAGGGTLTAALNRAGNGITITDSTSGATAFSIDDLSGTAAASLKIKTAAAAGTGEIGSGNLQTKYLSGATTLASLNGKTGVGLGTFKTVDSSGAESNITLTADDLTLDDVIKKINSAGNQVKARINDTGDGLLVYDASGTGSLAIRVADTTGSVASKLNIAGTSAGTTAATNKINGTFEKTIALAATDTLDTVVSKINGGNFGVSAAVIGDGSASSPYRLTLTAKTSGAAGRTIVDFAGADLGLTSLSSGQDAVAFYGSGDPATAVLLTSSSNTFDNAVQGVSVTVKKASTTPVTVTVTRDSDGIQSGIKTLVDTFNTAIDKLKKYDSYDDDTKKKGALLGDSTVREISSKLYNVVQGQPLNVSGRYRSLVEIGVTVGTGGKLSFDSTKFSTAYSTDPQSVEALLTAFDQAPAETRVLDANGNPIQGATVSNTEAAPVYNSLGLAELVKNLADDLTNSVSGRLAQRDKDLQDQITLQNGRIADFDVRLAAKREQLTAQFTAMEQAIGKLRTQQNSISSITAVK